MKRNKLFLSLSGLLLLTFIIASLTINVKGTSTLDYMFEKDLLYKSTDIQLINETFNLRNQTVYTEIYNATYSFTNDDIASIPEGFTVNETGGSVRVYSSFYNHENVVKIIDDGNNLEVSLDTIISIVSGTIEFYILFAQTNHNFYHYIMDDVITAATNLNWRADGKLMYYDTSWKEISSYISNTWYHILINFECGAESYKGLSPDTFNIYINGKKFGDYNFRGTAITMDNIRWRCKMDIVGTTYLDAIGYSGEIYRGVYFDVGSQDTFPTDITWDGTNFWVLGDINEKVYKYTDAGVYTDVYFNVGTQDTNPTGIIWDGTYFWVVGDVNDEVYKYTDAGIYTDVHFDVNAQDTNPTGITWDGSNFWIVGDANNEVYKYNDVGVYTDVHFDVGAQDVNPSSITWDGSNFWIVGDTNNKVYKYTDAGVYTDVYFDVGAQDVDPTGITWDGTYFWVVGNENDEFYKYFYFEYLYNIGDNMIPYIHTNNSLEVDKYEFALKAINNLYDTGDQNPSSWDTTTQGSGISQIGGGEEPTKDKIVYMFGTGVGNNFGIQKTDFTYTENFIDLNFGLMFISWSGSSSFTMIEIHSSDGTSIIGLAFYTDGRFAYVNESVHVLRTDIDTEINYDIGLHINYELDLCFIYYNVEGVLIETYVINLVVSGKTGLKEIDIDSVLSGTEFMIVGLDYVGVYANGLSNAGEVEYGYLTIDLESPSLYWNFEHHNNFSIIASGEFALYSSEGTYSIEESIGLVLQEIKYNNTKFFFNLYESGFTELKDPFLIVYLSDKTFNNISYLNVEGIKLSEGLNDYYSSYSVGGINLTKSYFWVDSNNRLQFSLTIDDDDLEYIQITFDIDNVKSQDRTISFTSNIDGDSKGFFSLDYTDDSSGILEFPYYETSTRVILHQTKTIQSFTILITDNDKDDNDLCTGYITNLKLLYNPDLEISILITGIIAIIIPLMVMVLPSIVMGKKFGISGIIVTFLLMSLVCVIGNLIPIWLFFIIAFSCVGFLLMKKEGVM